MWIIIWVLLSAILIGASVWSQRILLAQKKAWQDFAKGKSFSYNPGTFMGPAEMTGTVGDYKVSFFTAERQTLDVRSKRYVTVVEINVQDGLVDGGVMGTKEMQPFMQTLDRLHPYKINHAGWDADLSVFVRHDEPIDRYLTPARIDAAMQLLKTKNADVLLIFNDREIVVRLETADPMQDAAKIDKILKRTIALIDQLRITAEERAAYSPVPATASIPVEPATGPVVSGPPPEAPPVDLPKPTDL